MTHYPFGKLVCGLVDMQLYLPDGSTVRAQFLPFYSAIESLAYRMYFDNDKLPDVLW
jgi:hypothetical protein